MYIYNIDICIYYMYIYIDIHTYVYMIYTCSVFRIRAAFAWIMLVWFGSWHVCCLTRRAQVRAVCIYCSLAIKVGSCIENDTVERICWKSFVQGAAILNVAASKLTAAEQCCVVRISALISGLNASWCLRATAHALDILSDQTVVCTPVVCSWQRQRTQKIRVQFSA